MGCRPSRPAGEQRRVPVPRKGWEGGAQADVGETHFENNSRLHVPKDTAESAEDLENKTPLGSLPGNIPESSPSPTEQNRGAHSDGTPNGLISKLQHLENRERQRSSDILEELTVQGIIQGHNKVFGSGEPYDVMVSTAETPLRKPPARLKKLKNKREVKDTEDKTQVAEECRKTKEDELRKSLQSDQLLPQDKHWDLVPLGGAEVAFAEGLKTWGSSVLEPLDLQGEELLTRTKSRSRVTESDLNHSYESIGVVESDMTYNQADDIF